MSKDKLIETYLNANKDHYLFEWTTRLGKSQMTTTLLNKWGGKTLILCPNNNVVLQWQENIAKYNAHLDCDVICYQSVHKAENIYTTVVLDEMHTLTDARFQKVNKLKPKHWVGLSATLDINYRNYFRILSRNSFLHSVIDLPAAVEKGLLPKPNIVCVQIELDNVNPYTVYQKGKDKSKQNVVVSYKDRMQHIYSRDKNVSIKCTEQEHYNLLTEHYDYSKSAYDNNRSDDNARRRMLMAALKRKNFLADIKTRWVKKLIVKAGLEDKRVLIFASNIEQAEMLYEQYSIHYKSSNPKELIDKFNNKEIPILVSVNMLDMGVDIHSIDACIIIQMNNRQSSPVQRTGRSLLSNTPKIYTLMYKNTRDVEYVNKYLDNYPREWVQYRSLK